MKDGRNTRQRRGPQPSRAAAPAPPSRAAPPARRGGAGEPPRGGPGGLRGRRRRVPRNRPCRDPALPRRKGVAAAPGAGPAALPHAAASLRWLCLRYTPPPPPPRAGPCRCLPRGRVAAAAARPPPPPRRPARLRGRGGAATAPGASRPPRPSRDARSPADPAWRSPARAGGTDRPPPAPSRRRRRPLTLARRRRGHVLSRALRPRPPSGARPGGWPAGGGGEAARAAALQPPHTCGRRGVRGRDGGGAGRLHPGTRPPHGGAAEGAGGRALCGSVRPACLPRAASGSRGLR